MWNVGRLSDPTLALGMAAAALLLRAAALAVALPPPDPDQGMYVALAEGLASGRGFRTDHPFRPETHFGPLLPAAMAALSITGLPMQPAGRAVSTVAGAVCVGLVFLLGARLWGRSGAVVASLAALTHPGAISAGRQIYPETMSAACLLAALHALTWRRFSGLGFGGALGLAALARREAVLLLVPGLCLLAWRRTRVAGGSTPGERTPSATADVAVAVLAFTLLFAPYVAFLRATVGHFTMSGQIRYAFYVARLMEEHPGRTTSVAEAREMERRYPAVADYVRDRPASTALALGRTALFHLRATFFQPRTWPWGIAGILGVAAASRSRRLSRFHAALLALPFLLLLAWAVAGPFYRYVKALAPIVALMAGGLVPREARA